MRMTKKDWINAIIRNEEFLNDYKEYLKLSGQAQEKKYTSLCKKWKSDILLVYLYYKYPDHEVYDYGVQILPKPAEDKSEGRYLYLRVDLSKTCKALGRECTEIIRRLRPKEKGRNGKALYSDQWDIYDMIHKQGYNLNQIAKELTGAGKGQNPAYNDEVGKEYKRVEYAYKKACAMMDKVQKLMENEQAEDISAYSDG